jgi:putative ABC transport system permease protein
MKFLPLLWQNLMRRKVRTLLTLLSVVVAFMLLGALMAIRGAFGGGATIAGAERMVVLDKVSLINPLPISYRDRIRDVAGVADVTHANWFGGTYQDQQQSIATMAVDPESWLRVHRELIVPAEQRSTWLANRTGALVGIETARQFGWHVGDRVPLQGTIYRRPDGRPWEFTIDAIYDSDDGKADRTRLFVHYDYVNEAIAPGSFGRNAVSWYVIKVASPAEARTIADRLDDRFANSSSQTRTATERVFVSNFARKVGEVGTITIVVSTAVLFMILLVSGNTMAQAVRERTGELAVMKAMGFSDARLFGLVIAESSVLALVGGGAGLGSVWAAIPLIGDPTHGLLPPVSLSGRDAALGLALMAGLGVMTGLLPAMRARRLRIVNALRRS